MCNSSQKESKFEVNNRKILANIFILKIISSNLNKIVKFKMIILNLGVYTHS